MSDLAVLVKKDLLEQWRTKKILILIIVFSFVAIGSPIFAKITPEILKSVSVPGMTINIPTPTYIDSLDQFIKNTSQIALLVLVFVVAGAVSDEKNKKTLEMLLTKPVSRTNFILSKFVASFVSIGSVFIAMSIIFYLYTVSLFSVFDFTHFSLMVGNVLLYILMIVSITILASTIVKNSITAGGIGFISFIVFGAIFGIIKQIENYSPNLIFSRYTNVVKYGWNHDLTVPIFIIVITIILAITMAILLFRTQEIER